MSIESASTFLVSSILLAVSFLILAAAITAINLLLQKYWRPVTIFSVESWTLFGGKAYDNYVANHPEYKAAQDERIAPVLEESKEKK